MKNITVVFVLIISTFLLAACGSENTDGNVTTIGNPSGDSGTLEDIASLSTFGSAEPDDDFATSGSFAVDFVAEDADGNAVLASLPLPDPIRWAFPAWLVNTALAADGDVTCTITVPEGSTCTTESVNSTNVDKMTTAATAILFDGSGSMRFNDPDKLRAEAAKTFLQLIETRAATNKFALYDFTDVSDMEGTGWEATPPFTRTREIFPWSEASAANLAAANTAIDESIDDFGETPLFQSLEELATAMQSELEIAGFSNKNILLFSDGANTTEESSLAEATQALGDDITVYVVGLLPATGGNAAIESLFRTALEPPLIQISNANNGYYAYIETADDIEDMFTLLMSAATSGANTAVFTLSPVPESGQIIEGQIGVEGLPEIMGSFSFVVP